MKCLICYWNSVTRCTLIQPLCWSGVFIFHMKSCSNAKNLYCWEDRYKHSHSAYAITNSNTSSKRVRRVSDRNSGATLVLQQKDQAVEEQRLTSVWEILKDGLWMVVCPSIALVRSRLKCQVCPLSLSGLWADKLPRWISFIQHGTIP